MRQSILNHVYNQGVSLMHSVSWRDAQKRVDNSLACFEEGLNIAGYVPLLGVCKVSGELRIQYGCALICASVALAALVAVGSVFARSAEDRNAGFKMATLLLTTYGSHGFANIGRGCLEVVPYLSLVTCLPYDMTNNRYKYPTEIPGRWVYIPA